MTEIEFPFLRRPTGGVLGETLAGRLRAREDVVIDVGGGVLDAVINRGGLPVKPQIIDPDRLDEIILDRPIVTIRVISQSIPPGTSVPQGTTVNLVLTRTQNLPIGSVKGVHRDLRNDLVKARFEGLGVGSATVRRLLARSARDELTDADRAEVRTLFENQGIAITDEPDRNVDAALETLKMLSTFGGGT